MNKLRLISCLALLAVLIAAPVAIAAQSLDPGSEADRRGSWLFQVGAGLSRPSYGPGTSSVLDSLASYSGVSRAYAALDLGLGYAIGSASYLLLDIRGTGDRLDDGIDWLQYNMLAYLIGGRWYPSATGFYLQGGLGIGLGNLQSSAGDNIYSDRGTAAAATLGMDFLRRPRGFGLTAEIGALSFVIEGESSFALTALLNLCWK